MPTGGQVSWASPEVTPAGDDASPTACEFDPKIWPNRELMDEPIDDTPDDADPRTLLPLLHPASTPAASTHNAAVRT